jgi:polysaccharide export outer membrane protein
MTRWARILFALGAMLVVISDAGAEAFTDSFGGGDAKVDSNKKASDGFAPAPKTRSAAPDADAFGAPGLPSLSGYKIGPTDVLDISVFGVPELTGTLVVSDNGTIQLPLLGETPAAGKTARELQRDLGARLGAEYLQNPQVLVSVKEFNSRSVILTGEIAKPGVYPLKGRTSLLQLVAGAGGFGEGGDSTVIILRKSGGKRAAAKFDISAIEKGQAEDPILQAGDTVVAGSSVIKKAYKGFLKALPIAGAFMMF